MTDTPKELHDGELPRAGERASFFLLVTSLAIFTWSTEADLSRFGFLAILEQVIIGLFGVEYAARL